MFKKYFNLILILTMMVGGVLGVVQPSFALPSSCPSNLMVGDEIKVPGKPAIYVLDNSLKPRYFFSGYVYKSFKEKYGGYKTITQECLLSLGSPNTSPFGITYRPGSYIVKRSGDNQLYAVLPGNSLAKISSGVASTLHRSHYQIQTLDDREWNDYTCRKADITDTKVYPGMTFRTDNDTSKVWYLDSGYTLHQVTALEQNFIVSDFIYTVPASAIQGLSQGGAIVSSFSELTDRTQSTLGCGGNPPPPNNGDTQAPTVSVTNPNNNGNVIPQVKDAIPVTASATDNVGVTRIDFYANATQIGSSNNNPATINWDTKTAANGNVTLTAKAYDAAGNVGVSQNVIVNVNNAGNPPPSGEMGTLKIDPVESWTPMKEQTVKMGATDVQVFGFKLSADKEPVKVTNLKLVATKFSPAGKLNAADFDGISLVTEQLNTLVSSSADPVCAQNQELYNCTFTLDEGVLADKLVIQPGSPLMLRVRTKIGKAAAAPRPSTAVAGNMFYFGVGDVKAKGVNSTKDITATGNAYTTALSQIIPGDVRIEGYAPASGKLQVTKQGSYIGIFKIYNDGASSVSISRLKFNDLGSHTGTKTTYSLGYNYEGETATIAQSKNPSFDFSNINGGAGILIDPGRFRYVAVYLDEVGDAKGGETWGLSVPQVSVSAPSLKWYARESLLQFDNNYDGDMNDFVDNLAVTGEPRLGTAYLEGGTPPGL